MLFWIITAALTVAASLTVLLPLARRVETDGADNAHDIEVYRDQLSELDRDAARGLIAATEAQEARAEIGRRILHAAAGASGAPLSKSGRGVSRALGLAGVLAVPLISWGFYADLGSPALPGQPLSARLQQDPATTSMDELVARAEGYLVSNPEDGRGWDVLAPIYQRAGRFDDAVAAYRSAIKLVGPSGDRFSGLGESLSYAAGGTISIEAKASFDQSIALDPQNVKARFYLAALLAQDGKFADAVSAWRAMTPDLPADSPWRNALDGAIAEAERRQNAGVPTAKGPTQSDVEAAASMSDGDRNAMIETMVAGLDAKLRENPRDLDGWLRLVRSYVVIGKADDARDALGRGKLAFESDGSATAQLEALATSLGLQETRKE